jgi:hypothetical protein
MPHTIENATTGRSKCRACGQPIPKDTLRFGERLANPFGDEGSETTHWYHVLCGAYRRPESFNEILESDAKALEDYDRLSRAVAFGITHRRVERINLVERAASGRARCRHCRETIVKDDWRIGLIFFEEGMANPAGFIHLSCAPEYFETTDIIDRLHHFGVDLSKDDQSEIERFLT